MSNVLITRININNKIIYNKPFYRCREYIVPIFDKKYIENFICIAIYDRYVGSISIYTIIYGMFFLHKALVISLKKKF